MSYLAALQLSTLPMSEAKLDYYAFACSKKDIDIIVLGEYVLNSFFKELEKMPIAMVEEQSNHKVEVIKNLSKKYSLTFIAPIVRIIDGKFEKHVLKSSPKGSIRYYPQFFLLNYKHWNEDKFFNNSIKTYTLPTFMHKKLKYAIVFGYELFFDHIWQHIDEKKVDIVLMPSVSTFGSIQRWQEMLKMRALTHNVYVLRVNRVGNYKRQDGDWHFYGHSMLINPHGEVEEFLDDKEALMITEVQKESILEARQVWGWRKQLQKKALL